MPAAQVIDLNPSPRTSSTPTEKFLSSFSNRYIQNAREEREADALKEIYSEYQQDGKNIEKLLMDIQTKPNISPTTRVNTAKQLLEFHKYNGELQKKAALEARKDNEKKSVISGLEAQRNLPPGSLAEFESNPVLAEKLTRPESQRKGNQADRPIDPEQQKNIDQAMSSPYWKKATLPQKNQILNKNNVSAPNQKLILDIEGKAEETALSKEKYNKEFEYKVHKDTAKFDEQIAKEAKAARVQLDAIKDVGQAIEKVSPKSLANVFKTFGPVGKAISNAVLSGSEAAIQASVPAFLEGRKELFGVRLSDADLALLSDKLPDIGKSVEANKQILKMMTKYSRLAIEREKIASKIKKENKGFRPLDYAERVEGTFAEMKKPVKIISPVTNRVIEIPAFELQDAINAGATLYNE
jgi:hypothetical protein